MTCDDSEIPQQPQQPQQPAVHFYAGCVHEGALEAVEAVEAFRNHHMSSGTPPRDRSRPPQNREALEKLEIPRTPDRGGTEVRDRAKSAEATSYFAGQ